MEAAQKRALIKKRATVKSRVTRIQKFVNSYQPGQNTNDVKVRQKLLLTSIEEYNEIQTQLEIDDPQEASHDADREQFEELCLEIQSKAESVLYAEESPSHLSHGIISNSSALKLPTVELPKFSGSLRDFMHFYDTFEALIIKNESLSDIQRYYYLLSCLSGEAHHLIEHLPISQVNFKVAWDMIRNRYHNPNLISDLHVKELLNLPTANHDSSKELRMLINQVTSNLNAVEILKMGIPLHEAMLSHLVLDRIGLNLRKQWENSNAAERQPRLKDLIKFLEGNCQTLDIVASARSCPSNSEPAAQSSGTQAPRRTFIATSNFCPLCKSNHNLHKCPQFTNLSVRDRVSVVRKHDLCFNCMRSDHRATNCHSTYCKHCNKRHHTMLHEPKGSVASDHQNQSYFSVKAAYPQSEVLLSTAVVTLTDKEGRPHNCRALIDSASQMNFISQELVNRLGLILRKHSVPVNGITNIRAAESSHFCQVQVTSRTSNFSKPVVCSVLGRITGPLPSSRINYDDWQIPIDLPLADPNFHQPREIDLLLGATVFFEILRPEQLCKESHPTLQNTQLGWVLSGCVPAHSIQRRGQATTTFLTKTDNLHSEVDKFWNQEEVTSHSIGKEHPCEEHFKMSYSRDETGRFQVKLPLQRDTTELGDSITVARRNFAILERRLHRNPSLRYEYIKFMDEYIKLGHMERVGAPENNAVCYYMLHHPVIKESSSTTKVRVVFNASSKTTSGMSLNDLMFAGPTIQQELFAIFLRFRTHHYVLIADIEKMYRQIKVSEDDRDLQRILWRRTPSEPLEEYRLTTVTYGTAAAPYLATRCLKQVALDGQWTHPFAAEVIQRDFYVDDLLTGTNSIADGIHLFEDVSALLNSAGFVIRKWQSNSADIMETIPTSLRENQNPCDLPSESESVRTLGLVWHPSTDEFQFQVSDHNHNGTWTKRTVLAKVASIFDPMGVLGPVIVLCKIFIQAIWQERMGWDDPLPPQLSVRWEDIHSQLPVLNKIRIPRRVMSSDNPKGIELHGFADASEKAYGACIYLRSVSPNGNIKVELLSSKSRVAPLKRVTLPRLELNAALLLSRLMDKVQAALSLEISQCYYWTDSTITLAWIAGCPSTWKTYVANRVSEIQQLTSNGNWNHVSSSHNPADIVSRGINPHLLEGSCLSWAGPYWLSDDSSTWPSTNIALCEEIPEKRSEKLCLIAGNVEPENNFSRFSSWSKLQRVMAYVLRFVQNTRNTGTTRMSGPLTTIELRTAMKVIVRTIQHSSYSHEIQRLQDKRPLSHHSKLLSLHPFLDNDNLLRVGGRLQNSEAPFDQKHPMILPEKHHVTELIIANEHMRLVHGGTQLVLASLRQRFWIVKGRSSVKKVIHNCINCFKLKANTATQIMGHLPEARVTPSKPFSHCGVDYGGPLLVKYGNPRSKTLKKCYIALFVCMCIKAVHIEIVTDLTSEAFIAALRRFVARRGRCTHIYSDNGTCFVGANRKLNEMSRLFRTQDHVSALSLFTSQEGIEWHYIPPNSPHFGGLWEAAIKSVKSHLKKTVGNGILTLEELLTLLTQIEACLNSRPITPLADTHDEFAFLTPGHFLVGEPLISFSEPDWLAEPPSRLARWQQVQRCRQIIWKRWSSDYLSQLQQRTKWRHSQQNIQQGRLVLVKDDHVPPLMWTTGIIESIHPGSDGLVRVVTVRTNKGLYKRPITKIAPFPDEIT